VLISDYPMPPQPRPTPTRRRGHRLSAPPTAGAAAPARVAPVPRPLRLRRSADGSRRVSPLPASSAPIRPSSPRLGLVRPQFTPYGPTQLRRSGSDTPHLLQDAALPARRTNVVMHSRVSRWSPTLPYSRRRRRRWRGRERRRRRGHVRISPGGKDLGRTGSIKRPEKKASSRYAFPLLQVLPKIHRCVPS
jgi:hypothetical protein